jgi:hypothetical protein
MLKPTGFFDRNLTLGEARARRALPRRNVMSACSGG